jgi:hypothetical protein
MLSEKLKIVIKIKKGTEVTHRHYTGDVMKLSRAVFIRKSVTN